MIEKKCCKCGNAVKITVTYGKYEEKDFKSVLCPKCKREVENES